MADIKTRTVDKSSIKTIDRSISASHRIRDAGSEIRQAGRREVDMQEESVSEYSTARFEGAVQRTVAKTEHVAEWGIDKGTRIAHQKMRDYGIKEKIKGEVIHNAESTKNEMIKTIAGERITSVTNGIKGRSDGLIKSRQNIKMRKEAKVAQLKSQEAMRNAAKNSYKVAKNGSAMVKRIAESIARGARALYLSTKALISAMIAGGWVTVIIVVCCVVFGAALYLFGGSGSNYTPVSPEVEAYSTTITKYAKEYDIEEYTELIKAVMMQESGGKGKDPMKSSNFSFNTEYPYGITDPEYSIKCGVQQLAKLIKESGCESPLDMTNVREVLKSYNSGEDDDAYVNNVLQYYPYGNFSDEVLILGDGTLGLPIQGMTQSHITSRFGNRESPGGIGSTNHKGLDIGFPTGTKVYACESGKVTFAGWSGGFGKLVIIDHGNDMQTYYAHLSKINTAKGIKVVRGQNIGEVGNTGNSTGPHLHLGVMVNGVFIDPEKSLYVKP